MVLDMLPADLKLPEMMQDVSSRHLHFISRVLALCLVILGIVLSGYKLKDVMSGRKNWIASILKLLALPGIANIALALLVTKFGFEKYRMIFTVLILAAACPTANNVLQIVMLNIKGEQESKDIRDATSINVLTMCMCVFTIPLMILLYMSF